MLLFDPYLVFGKNLESELMSETSGHFKRLLVSLCTANRDESGVTDIEAARRDATALLEAGVKRFGTDESTFNMILCRRSFAQIRLVSVALFGLSNIPQYENNSPLFSPADY